MSGNPPDSVAGKKQNPPGWRRVGRKPSAYPHTGARVQQQQHGMQKARMPIGYAGQNSTSNPLLVPVGQNQTFTTEDTEARRGTPQRKRGRRERRTLASLLLVFLSVFL